MIKKSIKYLITVIYIVFTSSCLSATDVVKDQNSGDLFLWELTKGGSTIYLAGSVHVASADMYPLNQEYYKALNSSEYFVMEADVVGIDQGVLQALTLEHALFSGGDKLSDYLDDLYIEKLNNTILNQFNMTIEHIDGFKPWFVSTMISALTLQVNGLNPDNGIDIHFQDIANEKGMNSLYLEKADDQIKMISSFPMEFQLNELKNLIDDYDNLMSLVTEITTSWSAGDLSVMEELILSVYEDSDSKVAYDILFTKRNRDWANQIEELIKTEENYFIIVGSGHLVGSDSLIEILLDRGYSISRK